MKRIDKRRLVKRALRSAASREVATKAKPKVRLNAMRMRPRAVRRSMPRMDMLVGPTMAAVIADDINRTFSRGETLDLLNTMAAIVIRPEHHPGGGRRR